MFTFECLQWMCRQHFVEQLSENGWFTEVFYEVSAEWTAAVLFTQSAASFRWKHRLLHKNSNCAFTPCHAVSANAPGIQFPPVSVHATIQLVQIRKTMSAPFLTPQTCSAQHWSAVSCACEVFKINSIWFYLYCCVNCSSGIPQKLIHE